jgi:hypothetical protein
MSGNRADRLPGTAAPQGRLLNRPTFGGSKIVMLQSSFTDLAAAWLTDLGSQRLVEGTKQSYRDQVRLHVQDFHDLLGRLQLIPSSGR